MACRTTVGFCLSGPIMAIATQLRARQAKPDGWIGVTMIKATGLRFQEAGRLGKERNTSMQPTHRFPTQILVFTLVYVAAIGLPAMQSEKPEFVSYLLLMVALITVISIVDRRSHLSRPLLWCLSAWGFVHMAGGLVRIPSCWPYNGPDEVLYSLWLVPDRLKYDQIVHVFGFGTTTWLWWEILRNGIEIRYGHKLIPTFGLVSLCIAGGMGLGAFNEMVEFIATLTLPNTNVGGYENTSWDLVSNQIGSVFAGLVIYLRGHRTEQAEAC
jgi:hypothetical protein